jgi:indole-3-glycerol phosphate synthase
MGASAILLTAEVLPGAHVPRLVEACLRHGVTPFVEVSGAEQLKRMATRPAARWP